MEKILVVEDDKNTNEVICDFLVDAKYDVYSAFDGQKALEIFGSTKIDFVILDIMLPKIDGITVLKRIREISKVPVLMLTAMGDEYTQIISFDKLADDYIVKPFSLVLLVKRVHAILRRTNSSKVQNIKIGNINIDFNGYKATDENGQIDLTTKEIELLKFLVENKNRVMSREQILNQVWGEDYIANDRKIDTHIKNIRKKLNQNCIVTVKGIGYKFEDEK